MTANRFRQLAASTYHDEMYFRQEIASLYHSRWFAAGFVSEISKPGDCVAREVGGEPLLLTRDLESNVHAFANVCRHRGHLLVDKPCASQRLLICPYHAWSYALDGKLVRAPYWDGTKESRPSPGERESLTLIEYSVAIWFDIVFVNFDPDAADFNEFISPLDSRWRTQCDPTLLRAFSRRDFRLPGNWKLVAENFLDNYHLPWIHPQVGESIEGALGMHSENLQLGNSAIGFSLSGSGSEKKKTSEPLPFWPGMDAEQRLRQELFFLFPNICLVMEGNYLWAMILMPTSASTCDEIVSLYVIGDEAMSDQYEVSRKELEDSIYEINGQDNEVIRNLQAGRQSDAASRGVFNTFHDQLGIWFQQHVAQSVAES